MNIILNQIFQNFSGRFQTWKEDKTPDLQHNQMIRKAVDYVVDNTFPNMRVIPGYAKRLRQSAAISFEYIDQLLNVVPESFECSRETFIHDPRVNAFFVNPNHLCEVFSTSAELREFFQENPFVEECYLLLCMHKSERRQLGIAIQGDKLQRDVEQVAVNFADHQIIAPNTSEEGSRRGLKCCIFRGLVEYIRYQGLAAKSRLTELNNQRHLLHTRLNHHNAPEQAEEVRREIAEVEAQLAAMKPSLTDVTDYLNFVDHILRHPEEFISASQYPLTLNRLGIKQEKPANGPVNQLILSEIDVARKGPRIAALVHFPRKDLLPQQNFLKKADLFLNVL